MVKKVKVNITSNLTPEIIGLYVQAIGIIMGDDDIEQKFQDVLNLVNIDEDEKKQRNDEFCIFIDIGLAANIPNGDNTERMKIIEEKFKVFKERVHYILESFEESGKKSSFVANIDTSFFKKKD